MYREFAAIFGVLIALGSATAWAADGEFYSTDGRGNITLMRSYASWYSSWDQIVPGKFNTDSYTDLLFYDRETSRGVFYSTDGRANINQVRLYDNWRKTWSQIVPGNFNGDGITDLLFYDASDDPVLGAEDKGEGFFYSTDGRGNINRMKSYDNWRKTWYIVPGNFNNDTYTDLLFYDSRTGEGEFYSTDGRGNISKMNSYNNWRKTWKIVPGNFNGDRYTDLLFYDGSAGEGYFYTTDGRGHINRISSKAWRKTWDNIVPGNFNGDSYTDLLFYDGSSGEGWFYSTDGSGNINRMRSYDNWRTYQEQGFWDYIIPGSFNADRYSDLLFYDDGIEVY